MRLAFLCLLLAASFALVVVFTPGGSVATGAANDWARRNAVAGEARCLPEANSEGYQDCKVGTEVLHCTGSPIPGCHRAADHRATSTSTGAAAESRQ